jgi:hypothetical protein
MSNPKPVQATVRHGLLQKKTVPECLSTLDNTCAAGAQSPEVQGSAVAKQALAVLQTAVQTAHGSLSTKLSLAQALMAAAKALRVDFEAVKVALVTYEASVGAIAKGDATIINKAGLLSRTQKAPAAALGAVTTLHTKPGKVAGEAIISWPAGPGATGYAIEVNFTPANPAGPFTALTPGTGRRRVVKAPAPGAQFLARVASLGSGGTQAPWSDPILATAR